MGPRKTNEEYGEVLMEGILIRPKKNSKLAKDTKEELKKGLEPK